MNRRDRWLANRALVERARSLRRDMTPAERILWKELRRHGLGRHVRRQAVIGPFFADFAILPARLIVEVDGGVHDSQVGRDRERTEWFERAGYSR